MGYSALCFPKGQKRSFSGKTKAVLIYYTSLNDYLMNNLLKIYTGIFRKGVFKKMEHSFAVTAALLLALSLVVFGAFAAEKYFSPGEETLVLEENASFEEEPEEEKMLLGIFEGKLALFVGKSPYPNRIYDFLIRTLPQEDRKSLSEGIEIKSEEELESLLEDFMS